MEDNNSGTKTVLLIEDDPDLAELISEYLGMNYYEVQHAPTATEGLETLFNPAKSIDLVILDLMLPDMDGMQVCQRIRQHKDSRLAQTAIIMLTAKGDTTDRVLGLEMGADDYVSKPFEPRELLARIRDIRASEKRVYLRVREIFTLAADYQPSVRDTNLFFQTIQNKLHFASTGQTAAELVYRRADAAKPFMGLTHTAAGEVRKKDIKTAKNYLHEMEIDQLNRIVTMWLDFAEDQAQRKKQVFLRDWAEKLDQFLQFNDREVLQGAGKISKKQADAKAEAEYERYAAAQRQLKETQGESDIAELLKLQPKK